MNKISIILIVSSIILSIVSVIKNENKVIINKKIIYVTLLSIIYMIVITLDKNGITGKNVIEMVVIISGWSIIMILLEDVKEIRKTDILVIMMTNISGLLIILNAQDFITFYLGLELQTLGAYVLAGWKRNSELSVEAGLKYYVLGSMASGLLLFGISIIYLSTGTVNYSIINNLSTLENTNSLFTISSNIGLLFIVIAILFKIGSAPFHSWVPDVYQGSPTLVTAYFSTIPKLALFTAFVNILINNVSFIDEKIKLIFIIASILSMLVGSIAAINQFNLKRLLAYSSISHTGYLLIGITVGTLDSYINVFVYLIIYIITNIAIWNILINSSNRFNLKNIFGTFHHLIIRNDEQILDSQFNLKGYGFLHPWKAMVLSISLLSLAGIPPLAGFFSKWYLFLSAINGGYSLLAIFGVVTSVISAVYYIRLIHLMFFQTPDLNFGLFNSVLFIPVKLKIMNVVNSLILAFSVYFLIFIIFDFDLIINLSTWMAQAIFN